MKVFSKGCTPRKQVTMDKMLKEKIIAEVKNAFREHALSIEQDDNECELMTNDDSSKFLLVIYEGKKRRGTCLSTNGKRPYVTQLQNVTSADDFWFAMAELKLAKIA